MKESLWMMSGSMREGIRETMREEVRKLMKSGTGRKGIKEYTGKVE